MSAALADHDRILRAAIERFGGRVFSTGGDSFAAIFATGPDAIAAAVESQLGLQRPDVRGDILRVRMAVHVGEAERRGDDYFGPALNRCARLMAVGHGGQILVSLAAAESYHTRLGGIALVGLGEHRLKDLTRSEHVFQVSHPDLPSEFPYLRSLDVHSHNLPIQVTSFIGREKELEQVRELLGTTRLLKADRTTSMRSTVAPSARPCSTINRASLWALAEPAGGRIVVPGDDAISPGFHRL